jgi:hypothetical protein
MLVRILSLLVLLSTFMHCSSGSPTENPEDKILARVHNKELKLSELEGMFPQSASGQDSSLIIQAFVNRWIKDAVLQWESERNLPTDLNIDGLVRDYRASLVRSTYEKVLVEQLLDSVVTQTQLEDYYATNKNQYLLEKPIIRCYFIKVPYPTPEAEKLQNLWSNGSVKDTMALVDYSNRFAQIALLKSQSWYSLDEVAEQFPEGTLTADNVRSKQEFTQQDGQYRYYFRLFELKPRLERQARRIILHDRSRKVLEDAKEEIFQRELRRSNVETFTN